MKARVRIGGLLYEGDVIELKGRLVVVDGMTVGMLEGNDSSRAYVRIDAGNVLTIGAIGATNEHVITGSLPILAEES